MQGQEGAGPWSGRRCPGNRAGPPRRPHGSPTPLRACDVLAQFHQYHGLAHETGWTSGLHGWVAPGVYPELRIKADSVREAVIEHLYVRDDGPTCVDVEPDPR